ncbi:tRNA dihydrouridine synthase [Kineobactrum salinum]
MLAPMQGVTDHTMRALLTELGGIDRCVTEFIRIGGQLLPPRVFHRICPELAEGGRTASGVPVYVQLLGGQPGPMADNAARCAELGAAGIDLNFGCPARTVNRSDGGAIILREPERVRAIVSAVRAAVDPATPVSVKIRLGFEDRSRFLDNVAAVAEAGAAELVIHARTKRDGYRPPAYWEEIAVARDTVKLPIIANGEIWSPDQARRCRELSGCEDLMLGRGALCRPDLPRLIAGAAQGQAAPPLTWDDILPLLRRFLALNLARYDHHYVGNPLKQWLLYLRSYFPQGAVLFEALKRLQDPAAIDALLTCQPPLQPAAVA